MQATLTFIDIMVCTLIFLRIVCYRKRSATHRPIAAFIAWVLACASGAVPVLAVLNALPPPGLHDVAMHAVLLLALLATRGNVSELFHTSGGENLIYRIIRRSHHAQG